MMHDRCLINADGVNGQLGQPPKCPAQLPKLWRMDGVGAPLSQKADHRPPRWGHRAEDPRKRPSGDSKPRKVGRGGTPLNP